MPRRKPTRTTKSSVALALGRMLRAEREKTGLSQEEFSEVVSLSKNYIGNIERGEYEPSLSVLLQIAKALKRSASDLLAACGYSSVSHFRPTKMLGVHAAHAAARLMRRKFA